MKTKIKIVAIITSFFAFQMNAQNKITISVINSEISDNLDLTAVSSIFGESESLEDFEKRLNDAKLQISNLDLNNDDLVDYLRVIESVKKRTHIIIIQSIIGNDLYQDVATIEIEKDRHNKISIQIVGNKFIYGRNYIYEPYYYNTPQIYASFWMNNYKPYYSCWTWNYYPTYYYYYSPYTVSRYRQNIYGCVNRYNTYKYVNNRRCHRAPSIYSTYSRNSYERQYPQYAFSRRYNVVSNRYELDQRRYSNHNSNRTEVTYTRNSSGYSRNNTNYNRNTNGEYVQNRANTTREIVIPKTENRRDYTQNRTSIQRTEFQRDYSQDRNISLRELNNQRDYSQNRTDSQRDNNTQTTEPQRDYSPNRSTSQSENNYERTESQRGDNNSPRGGNR